VSIAAKFSVAKFFDMDQTKAKPSDQTATPTPAATAPDAVEVESDEEVDIRPYVTEDRDAIKYRIP
jgi:hypothetical protein